MDETTDSAGVADFSTRLIDNFFRRWALFLIPVVLLAGVGVVVASNAGSEFVARGTLSASANPLLPQPEIRTTTIYDYESPAQGTARLINEQLQTDVFLDDVAERAGLTTMLEQEFIDRDTLRSQIVASATGQNFLKVNATWGDPDVAFGLVQSTIAGYLDYVADVVTGDSVDAIQFLNERLSDAEARVVSSQDELDAYVGSLPILSGDAIRSTEQALQIGRLSSGVDRAIENVEGLRESIDTSELSVERSLSEAGRLLRVVDEPTVPLLAESTLLKQALSIVTFTMLGVLLSLAAMVVVTLADSTIRSQRQLSLLSGAEISVTLPRVRNMQPNRHRKAA